MPNKSINLSPLRRAVNSLKEAIKQPMLEDAKLGEFIRDSIIQRFEYTYELSWKLLKRYLEKEYDSPVTSVKHAYREAARIGLIDNLEAWFSYQEARNLTSHTYNEDTAEETCAAAKKFAVDAEKLLNKFTELLSDSTK